MTCSSDQNNKKPVQWHRKWWKWKTSKTIGATEIPISFRRQSIYNKKSIHNKKSTYNKNIQLKKSVCYRKKRIMYKLIRTNKKGVQFPNKQVRFQSKLYGNLFIKTRMKTGKKEQMGELIGYAYIQKKNISKKW